MTDDSALLARIEALETRLLQLEDEREIRELLSRYGHYSDAMLDDDYVNLFTVDGAVDIAMGSGHATFKDSTRWVGREQVASFISDPRGHHEPGFYGRSMHLQGHNIIIRINGDSAVANNYSILLHQDGDTLKTLGAGINEWHFAKVDDRWLVKERIRRQVGSEETAQLLAATLP